VSLLAVPILVEGLTGVAEALELAAAAAGRGADLVEWRVDPLAAEPDRSAAAAAVARLLRDSPRPAILTCRDAGEGGAAEIDDEDRAILLEALLERGPGPRPRYVDLEWASWNRSPRLRQAVLGLLGRGDGGGGGGEGDRDADAPRLILSSHWFEGRPADLWSRVAAMAGEAEADVLKLAWTARSLRDVAEVAELLAERPGPMIALAMGPFGLPSRVLAGRFGGLLSFANLGDGTATAAGQPTIGVLQELYRFRDIGPATRVFGVVGMPVDHSLGPRLHNAAFRAAGEDAVYLPLPVDAGWESFKATLATLLETPAVGFAGASVTIPHKEHALRLAIERGGRVDPLAELAGAVNTLWTDAGGRLHAANTDAPAVLAALAPALAAVGRDPAACRVAILGAGGAARAAAAAFAAAGADVRICGRTASRVEALCGHLDGRPRPGGEGPMRVRPVPAGDLAALAAAGELDTWINATPVGMDGGPEPEGDPLPPEVVLGPGHAVLETVYTPLRTPLVRRAEAAGARVVTGEAMFRHQAEAQFLAWTGRPMPDAAWDAVRRGD
jgi:3-dehydroquinate dehydratase/shikimate dehydrogenase